MAFGRHWRDRRKLSYRGKRRKEGAMDLRENEMGLEEFGEFLLRRRIVRIHSPKRGQSYNL